MTKDEMRELRRMFDEHRREMGRHVTNYDKPKRVEWTRIAAFALGALGVLAAFVMFMFKTNAVADLEHAELTATHKRDVALQAQKLDTLTDQQRKALDKLDELGENQIKIGERLKVRGMKNGDD